MASTAVIVPGDFGVLHLYGRRATGKLHHITAIVAPRDLVQGLDQLPLPRLVILCGTRHLRRVADHVLDSTDLYIVPTCWLAALPAAEPRLRAAVAARLVAAHRRNPIERLVGPDQLRLPF